MPWLKSVCRRTECNYGAMLTCSPDKLQLRQEPGLLEALCLSDFACTQIFSYLTSLSVLSGVFPILTGEKPFTALVFGEKISVSAPAGGEVSSEGLLPLRFFHRTACCGSIQLSLYNWLLGALPWTGYSCWQRSEHLFKPTVVSPSSPWQVQTRNRSEGWGQEGLPCLARNRLWHLHAYRECALQGKQIWHKSIFGYSNGLNCSYYDDVSQHVFRNTLIDFACIRKKTFHYLFQDGLWWHFLFKVLFIYFQGLFEMKIDPGSCWHVRLPVPGLMLARAVPVVSRGGWKGICSPSFSSRSSSRLDRGCASGGLAQPGTHQWLLNCLLLQPEYAKQ